MDVLRACAQVPTILCEACDGVWVYVCMLDSVDVFVELRVW